MFPFFRTTAALVCTCLGVLAAGCGEAPPDDREQAIGVVRAYLEARADGDAERACDQLTEGQRFELVARVTGDFVSASASRCEQYVLSGSEASTATSADSAALLEGELDVRFRVLAKAPRAGSVQHEVGDGPFLEVIEEDDGWKVDGNAAEKASFIFQCSRVRVIPSVCACVFETGLRRRGLDMYGSSPDAEPVVRRAIQSAAGACRRVPS